MKKSILTESKTDCCNAFAGFLGTSDAVGASALERLRLCKRWFCDYRKSNRNVAEAVRSRWYWNLIRLPFAATVGVAVVAVVVIDVVVVAVVPPAAAVVVAA